MTPPTADEQDAALAALSGTINETRPVTGLDRNMLRLRLVMEAKQRGVSWTVIGATMGVSGKQAKRYMKQLAARTQHDLMAARNREAPGCAEITSAAGPVPVVRPYRDAGQSAGRAQNRPGVRKQQHHIRRRGR